MPFPKDLKTKHLGRLILCQLEQFIYLVQNSPFSKGKEHEIIEKYYITI